MDETTSDLCSELVVRYGNSSAAQHRQLLGAAAASRHLILSHSLPLSPLSYFAAAISQLDHDATSATSKPEDATSASSKPVNLDDTSAVKLDEDTSASSKPDDATSSHATSASKLGEATSASSKQVSSSSKIDATSSGDLEEEAALVALLAVALPLVPEKGISATRAAEAVGVLAEVAERGVGSVSGVVKCLGVLLGFCDLEDWDSVRFGVGKLLRFSIDKRPKVRRRAQDCVVGIFKSMESSSIIKEAGKLIFSMFKDYMPLALEICDSKSTNEFKDEKSSKPEHLDVIHMLTLLKHVVPYLSVKVSLKILQQLYKLMNSQFSPLTRHIFGVIEAIIESPKDEILLSEGQNITKSMASYVAFCGENPNDTLLSAAELLKNVFLKFPTNGESKRITFLPLVVGSIVNLLNYEAGISARASEILKDLISFHINSDLLTMVGDSIEDEDKSSMESIALKSTCASFESILDSCDEVPNEHTLAVISILFRELGDLSYFFMKGIILKLTDIMNLACENKYDTDHLQECIGSAVCVIGPKKMLTFIPLNLNVEDLTCSNWWLIPILRKYVTGSSLGFFMEHFVPLAKSFEKLSAKARKSGIQTDLQDYARAVWGLLPAFCHYPKDTHQNFSSLAELLVTLLQKGSFMLENTAIALQQLVNQNKSALSSKEGACETAPLSKTSELNDSSVEIKSKSAYTKKIAQRNIKALESCSKELLQALINLFFDSSPKDRAYLKDAIGSLASIADSSATKTIFVSSLERLGLINEEQNFIFGEKGENVSTALELASSLVEGSDEDLIALIFKLIKETLQDGDKVIQSEAYHTLAKILEEQTMFCSSHVNELVELLLGLKPPVNSETLGARLACFKNLLVHSIKSTSEEENPKSFLVLNEIILTIKDSNEEVRKIAYDMLIGLGSNLQKSSSNATPDAPLNKLISMIMGYLSAPSPQIKSGAVSALSILVYNNAEICSLDLDLVSSILALLKNKALEVIKAVLGFVKVLVSCQQARDLENMLPEITSSILPWSPVSRNHFREKVTVILEIMIRKCGSAKVESLVPDKYRSFIKGVQENRHRKQRSKETSATDLETENPKSFPKGQHKRKHDESRFQQQDDNATKKPRLGNWDKNGKGFIRRKNEVHRNGAKHGKGDGNSNNGRNFKEQSMVDTRNKGRDFKRESNQKKPGRRFVAGRKKP